MFTTTTTKAYPENADSGNKCEGGTQNLSETDYNDGFAALLKINQLLDKVQGSIGEGMDDINNLTIKYNNGEISRSQMLAYRKLLEDTMNQILAPILQNRYYSFLVEQATFLVKYSPDEKHNLSRDLPSPRASM